MHRRLLPLAALAALAAPATAHAGTYALYASGPADLVPLLTTTTPAPLPAGARFDADYRPSTTGVGIAARAGGRHDAGASASLTVPTGSLVLRNVSAHVHACAAATASGWSALVSARTTSGIATRIALRPMDAVECGDTTGAVTTPIVDAQVQLALRARTASTGHTAGTWAELRELTATIEDDTAPSVAVSVTRTSVSATAAAVAVTARDATSGVARVTAQADDGAIATLFAGAIDRALLRGQATGGADGTGSLVRTLALPAVAGTHHVTVVATDVAGNETRIVTPVAVTLAPVAGQPGPSVEPATARVGVALTATPGTWANAPASYAYTWLRVVDGVRETAASSRTYTPTRDDARRGARLVVRVEARNAAGGATAETAPLAPVVAATPAIAGDPPTVSGVARVDRLIAASPGAWDDGGGSLAFAYRWEACADAAGTACSSLPGAGSALVVPAAALGRRLRVVVTATGPGGSAEAASATGAVVLADAPTFARAPAIAGAGSVGRLLALDAGAVDWHGATGVLAARLLRCRAAACTTVADPAPATRAVLAADRGAALLLEATATSAAGVVTLASAPLAVPDVVLPPVAPTLPGDLPAIAGPPTVDGTLTASAGRFGGPDPFTLAYRWERCGAAGCTAIPGAADAAYRVARADLGRRLRVVVTASNAAGSATAASVESGLVGDRAHEQHLTGAGLGWAEAAVDGRLLRVETRIARRLVAAGGAVRLRGRVLAGRGVPRPTSVRVALRLDAPLGGAVVRRARVGADGRFAVALPARFGGVVEVATATRGYVRPLAVDAGRIRVRPRIRAGFHVTAHDLVVRGRVLPAAPGLALDLLVRWPGASRWTLFGIEQEPVVTRADGCFALDLRSETGYYVDLMRRARFRLAYRAEAAGPLAPGSSPAVAAG